MNSFSPTVVSVSNELALLFPRIVVGIALFIVGLILAKMARRFVSKSVSMLLKSSLVKNTPIEHFFSNADLTNRLDSGIGKLAYWFVLLLTAYVVSATVGLTSISYLLERVFSYLPRFFSAMVVFVLGVLLAGFVESFSKSSLNHLDLKMAKIVGKLSSYLVMVLAVMVAFSELGIARDFILILFIGMVIAIALGIGLAVGLGGQHLVRQLLESWSENQHLSQTKSTKK